MTSAAFRSPRQPCLKWAPEFNKTALAFGIALSGEWSLAINDCG